MQYFRPMIKVYIFYLKESSGVSKIGFVVRLSVL